MELKLTFFYPRSVQTILANLSLSRNILESNNHLYFLYFSSSNTLVLVRSSLLIEYDVFLQLTVYRCCCIKPSHQATVTKTTKGMVFVKSSATFEACIRSEV